MKTTQDVVLIPGSRAMTEAHAPRPIAVTLDGRTLECVEWPGGDGDSRRAIVLLHEGLGSVGLWRGFPAALAQATGRRVLAFSRWGHGDSAPAPAPRTPRFFHSEALEVLPALLAQPAIEATRPLLVGHSDGASIGLVHASEHPVSGLVLLAPHVFVEDVTVAAIRETRERYLAGELRDRLARHHADVDAAFWGWCDVWLDPAFRAWDLGPEIHDLNAPLLLIQGVEDPYGSLAQIDRIESAVAGPVTRLELSGGHSPQFEHPQTTVRAIAEFAAALP